ncbi:MAG: hypothetical protein QXD11_02080 [Candidatus Micrarchaeaceae archaeon]
MAVQKGIDRWKLKKWFNVHAPAIFNEEVIAEIPANDEKAVLNRRIKIGLDTLTHNPQNAYADIFFRITSVAGNNASTRLDKIELPMSYTRSLARKYRSIADATIKTSTKDNVSMKVKPLVITQRRETKSRIKGIRKEMEDYIKNFFSANDEQQAVMAIVEGKLQADLASKLGHIAQINKVEIKKLEVGKS